MNHAFIDNCKNVFGYLSTNCRARLTALIEQPSQATWDDAYSIIIDGHFGTLWQAWLAVDASAPRSKPCDAPWPRIPDQLTVYRALRHVHRQGHSAGLRSESS